MDWWLCLVVVVLVVVGGESSVGGENVTYDGRSLIIDGKRKLLFSGSIHYPRSTPEMWPSLIAKAKEGGLEVIQTYVFWNLHEPQPGQYDFSGRYDLVKFIKEIQAQGLYACLRIGPFIESEWTYGGFPFWLHDISGIVYRSDNEPFKVILHNILFQKYSRARAPAHIENEYQNIEAAFIEKGPPYVRWAATMAVGLQTGVPWIMCKQRDAPDPVINTCNGMRCGETFEGPNSPNKPSMWTENWTSFYQVFGGEPYIRSAQDIAFHVALFIAKNGSYVNYYMYHGGTNFGRTGAAFVTTSYYDQAPLDEYGLIRQPKWGHLKQLHKAMKFCSITLLQGVQTNFSIGQLQEAYMFQEDSGGCVAFLVNNNGKDTANVQFHNASFELLPKSISILPDCQNVIFNTATVETGYDERMTTLGHMFDYVDGWQEFKDVIPNFSDTSIKSNTLLEHMNMTKAESDYLWYISRFQRNPDCTNPMLHVESLGHLVHAFAGETYFGVAHGSHDVKGFIFESPILLNDDVTNISLLSVMVGLPAMFDAPRGDDPVALNLSTMGKGEAWVNGQSIGRYWISFHTSKGTPSQTLYHVPRSFLIPSANLLVLFEEVGGDPLHISLDAITISSVQNHYGHLSQ
ncbi:hypothetical protein RHGRI_029586 [Rhododendron griersonianum]|uniref:beta-galactosidase n=1 Tax=Rhododendron griersonianum TaxID=479676 RepID=A0AAV6IN80_9ERIC|nr:hypothetical protein RHGRI_029586 [Rhododendron griersonianum]